jgi:glucose-1-phosphate thymidylyltransferase
MDAIVLAGGYATRLWPITKDRPKMFLPLDGATVIDRILDGLETDDRIADVYVSTNERFADEFRDYLAETPFEKPGLSVEETTAEDEKFGVISALAQLVGREGIDDDTVVIAGDNYLSFDVSEFIDYFRAGGAPTIAAYDVGDPARASQYGVVGLDGDRVVDFAEKPADPDSSLVSIACYGFPAESVGLLDAYLAEDNNPDEPGWFVQWLQNRTPTRAFTFDGAWFDIGTPESYLDAVAYELDGDARVAPSATVENVTFGTGVRVMPNATVRDARLDWTVVFEGAAVRNATVRDSLLDRESEVDGVDLAGSVVGPYTRLEPAMEADDDDDAGEGDADRIEPDDLLAGGE